MVVSHDTFLQGLFKLAAGRGVVTTLAYLTSKLRIVLSAPCQELLFFPNQSIYSSCIYVSLKHCHQACSSSKP
jgi:hypothetical protein